MAEILDIIRHGKNGLHGTASIGKLMIAAL
jgi:hypothetical protein